MKTYGFNDTHNIVILKSEITSKISKLYKQSYKIESLVGKSKLGAWQAIHVITVHVSGNLANLIASKK